MKMARQEPKDEGNGQERQQKNDSQELHRQYLVADEGIFVEDLPI